MASGHCGTACEGSVADTLGVLEYDTASESVVASHLDAQGRGANPYTSPRGDYTILLSNNGSSANILRANANGSPSTLVGTVALGFGHGGNLAAVSDVAFIEDATHNIVIFSATTDNFIVLLDIAAFLNGGTTTRRIYLQQDLATSSSGHGKGAERHAVWAAGTNYVWINSNELQEIHVIELASDGNIAGARVARTLTGAPSAHLVYVNKYRDGAYAFPSPPTLPPPSAPLSPPPSARLSPPPSAVPLLPPTASMSANLSSAQSASSGESEWGNRSPESLAALIISVLAMLVSTVAICVQVAAMHRYNSAMPTSTSAIRMQEVEVKSHKEAS